MRFLIGAAIAVFSISISGPAFGGEGATAFEDPTTAMEFVSVPAGCFRMGDTYGDGMPDEYPVHEVCLDGFLMAKKPVTVAQFRKFVTETSYRTDAEKGGGCFTAQADGTWGKVAGASWRNPGFNQADNHPAVCISWNDTNEFIKWLSRKSGKTYRLPTEAEWEYAARGGTTGRNIWGDADDQACAYANVSDQATKERLPAWKAHDCNDGFVYTSPVGRFKANAFGLYDMMGNAWQWTGDWYGKDFYEQSSKKNPQGPSSGTRHVSRGGSWRSSAKNVRVSLRIHPPSSQSAGVGFRLVYSTR